jgi:hypothetical protein
MVDAARLPEPLDYYRRVLRFCSDWELNTLHFRLTDDQGTALRFSSVPDLVTHANAFTPGQLHELVEYGRSLGVGIIPEVEAFGHTGYITRSPAYAHLLDRGDHGEFTGIIPVQPQTTEMMQKLFREVASIFPSKYLHGGCDEVNWGGSALSRKALQTRSRAHIWGDYLNSLNQIVQSMGKQFIVWGDFVLHKEPEILSRLDKNIVIMDWNYWDTGAIEFRHAVDRVQANGSQAIGAPGLISYRWGARPGTQQLRNIDAFAEAYAHQPASLGVILANWVPTRYLQNSLWDGFVYAAVAFKDGSAAAQVSGLRRFVERHYGATWNEQWSEALDLLYDAAPEHGDRNSASPLGLSLPVPFSDEEYLAGLLRKRNPQPNPFPRLRSLLDELQPTVKNNLADFQSLALSVDYLDTIFWRDAVILHHAADKPLSLEAAQQLIEQIAERDRNLAVALNKDWDGSRFTDSPAKRESVFDLHPKDQMLLQWQRAAAFSAGLAAHPDRFYQLLQATGLA